MKNSALIWLVFNVLSTMVLAFYSMMEMACVSFNKVRLQYYVSKGYRRAEWLNYLLQNPSRLFGTTLIGVNIALVIGSECSREFYSAIGINPDLAPITQVIFVVIFGELAPMFAARHYAEHVAMLGIPLIYFSARLMTPFLWCIDIVPKLCNMLVGGQESKVKIYLTQEELQKVIEDHNDDPLKDSESDEFNDIVANIFGLRSKDLKQVMEPLNPAFILPANATIEQAEALLNKTEEDFIPIYNRDKTNIIGIATPRDMLRASESRRVRDYASPPWFVPETSSIMQILKQFRSNNESVAVILDKQGKAIGIVSLLDILEELFGKISYATEQRTTKKLMLKEKTFPGGITVADFNAQFHVMLDRDPSMTLSELISNRLGHNPEKGESIYIAPFELTVKETSLLDVKTVSISSRI